MNGQLLVQYEYGNTYFAHSDHLGTTRLLTLYPAGSIYDWFDYAPFGELWGSGGTTDTTHKFTGKERDPESGLDNFLARYDSSVMGRFMSPDWSATATPVPYADLLRPQSLNLYAYISNNPLNQTDNNGHGPQKPLFGKYTYRLDPTNPNDVPNIHIFKDGKEIARGRLYSNNKIKWDEKGAKFISKDIESEVYQICNKNQVFATAAEREAAIELERGLPRGTLVRNAFNESFSVLQLVDIILNVISGPTDGKDGYHLDLNGIPVISDLNKAARNLSVGTAIVFGDGPYNVYILGADGKFTNSIGCNLVQQPDNSVQSVCYGT